LPRLVSSDQLVEGNAKLSLSGPLAELIGPSISGSLVSVVGAVRTMFGGVLTYAVSAITLGLIRIPKYGPSNVDQRARPTLKSIVRDGLAYVFHEPILGRIIFFTGTSNFFLMGILSITVPFLRDSLHASSATIGVVFTSGSMGGILAGIAASRISRKVGSARIIWLPVLATGPVYLLISFAGSGWSVALYAIGMFALTASGMLFNVGAVSYRQLTTPAELLSRVNGAYVWASYGAIPFGALFGGTLGTWAGLRASILICSLALWGCSLFLVASPLRKMRDLPLTGVKG
jgi:predicted MFS family arabinose efflux permease